MAALLALCASVLFLRDGLWPGRALVPYHPEQIDVFRAEAQSGPFDAASARGGSTAGGDKYLQSLCWDRVLHDRLRAGDSPRWTRDIGGGAPFVPQMAQVYEPINALLLLLPSWQWYGPWYLLHQVLFGWLAYVFLRRLGLGHPAGLVGVVGAVLGLWTQCKLHHNVILTAALSLWPMLTACRALLAERVRGAAAARWVGWLALWTGWSWLSGFAVVSLQVAYLTVGYALLLAWQRPRGDRLRPLAAVAAGLCLGGLLSAAHMLPVLLASADSARDTSFNPTFLAANGLEPLHLLASFWPDLLSWPNDTFYADPSQPWRDVTRMPWTQIALLDAPLHPVTGGPFQSWVETSFAIGTIPTALAALAFADRRHRTLAIATAVAGLLALGFANADGPFVTLARFVPGLGAADLRRLLFVVAMSLCVLSALGAEALFSGTRRWPCAFGLAIAAGGSLWLLGWLAAHDDEAGFVRGAAELYAARHPGVPVEHAVQFVQARSAAGEWLDNHQRLHTTAWRTLLAALVGGVALLAVRRRKTAALTTPLLLAATAAELLHAGAGFFVAVPSERVATPPRSVGPALAYREPGDVRGRFQRLLAPSDGRAAGLYPPNLAGAHGLEDAAGYNPLPPRRYEEFFLALEPDRPGKASVVFGGAGVGGFHDPSSLRHPLADLYGIRFVLTDQTLTTDDTLRDVTPPAAAAPRLRLYERTTTLPRATFVREVDVVPDRQRRLAALADPTRDVRTRVVLEDERAPRPQPFAGPVVAEVTVVEHQDEHVVVRVQSNADGYLRLHDPFDAGWLASVAGEPTTIHVADHYLRAVYVPAGSHEVVFRHAAPRVLWPERLSLLALAVVLLLLTRREVRR